MKYLKHRQSHKKIFWDKYFQVYDILNEVIPYREMLTNALDALNIRPGMVVLDMGSGTGNFSVLVAEKGAHPVGIDLSKSGVMLHMQKLPKEKVFVHDVQDPLPFPECTFDAVCSINTLFTLSKEGRKNAVHELYRVLKDDGRIVLINLADSYKPAYIYIDHIKKSMKKFGLYATLLQVVYLFIPTVRMFLYNKHIQKNSGHTSSFFEFDEQYDLLKSAGFKNISKTKHIFARQAVFNTALKI